MLDDTDPNLVSSPSSQSERSLAEQEAAGISPSEHRCFRLVPGDMIHVTSGINKVESTQARTVLETSDLLNWPITDELP